MNDSSSKADPLVEDLIRIRRSVVRRSWEPLSSAAVDLLRTQLPLKIDAARKNESFKNLNRNDHLRAAIWERWDKNAFGGVKTRMVELEFGGPREWPWIARELQRRSAHFDDHTVIFLFSAHRRHLKALERLRFHVAGVVLQGKPGEALARLMRKARPPSDLKALGLGIRKARSDDLAAMLKIARREFRRTPQYSFFGGESAALRRLADELKDQLKSRGHLHFVITRGNGILGYFCSPIWTSPTGVRHGGVTLVFDQSIQGMGIAKTAYRILLEEMVRKKVEIFVGGTSQPAVLGLGRLMGRKLVVYILRYGKKDFPISHFQK